MLHSGIPFLSETVLRKDVASLFVGLPVGSLLTGLFSSFDQLESPEKDPDPAFTQLRQVLTPHTSHGFLCLRLLLPAAGRVPHGIKHFQSVPDTQASM